MTSAVCRRRDDAGASGIGLPLICCVEREKEATAESFAASASLVDPIKVSGQG
jgi:hypothetical protein